MTSERGGTLTRSFRIAELLELIDEGRMVLPEFQRDFDWNDERVSQLLATVARRWPAGSLLLQDFPGKTFYFLRPFEGGPKLNDDLVEFVVLDGQQRLTALYHAVYDAGPYVFAIRARSLIRGATIDDLEDSIESFSRDEWDREARERPWDPEHDWIPFYSLRSPADFFGWRDQIVARSSQGEKEHVGLQLLDAYRNGLEAFHTYMLPAVIVEQELEPAAIARIFERVNRGNLPLTAFDLMVAKTFESGWNLRDRWASARSEFPTINEFFGDDGMPVIRVIALKNLGSVREADVLRLPGIDVRRDWDAAVTATSKALTFLKTHCGVEQPDWLPYGGMAITLGALALDFDLEPEHSELRRWFLSRSFGLRYEAGANTATVEEYRRLRRVLAGERPLDDIPALAQVMREATRKRRSAIWRAFMCALALNGARDPVDGEMPGESRDVAHVLPRNTTPPPDTESEHLLVLNLILVDAGHVSNINGRGVEGLRNVLQALEPDLRNEVIASQLLPDAVANRPLDTEAFLDGRLQELDAFLEARIGSGLTRHADGDVPPRQSGDRSADSPAS